MGYLKMAYYARKLLVATNYIMTILHCADFSGVYHTRFSRSSTDGKIRQSIITIPIRRNLMMFAGTARLEQVDN